MLQKLLKQKRLILIGGVALAVLLVVLAVVLTTVASQPSKKDYQAAKDAAKNLEARYDELTNSLSSYTSSMALDAKSSSTSNAKKAYGESVKELNASFEKFDALKALNDKDVKAAYDNVVAKKKVILSFSDGFVLYRSSLSVCADAFGVTDTAFTGKSIAASHNKAIADCVPVLDELSKSKTKVFATYAKGFSDVLKQRQAVFDDYASKKLDDKQAGDKIVELGAKLKTVLSTTNGLQSARTEATTVSQLSALTKVLDEKIKQAS